MQQTENPETQRRLGAFSTPAGWKQIVLSLAVMIFLTAAVKFFQIPNPNMILITGLSVFTSLYGFGAGIACGAEMMLYSMYFFSTDHSFFLYTPLNLEKIAVILVGIVLNVLFIGSLKRSHTAAHNQLSAANLLLREDNLSLQQASSVDALTGTRNRYAFRRDYVRYQGTDIHVMMFDLDDFKHTNDTYGHAVGDYVLRHTGMFLRDLFGEACCYRYGGDEFLVVCQDVPEEEFAGMLTAVQERMHTIYLDHQHIPAGFSAGYVYGRADLSCDLRLMLRHADHNLYEAKRLGKDRFTGTAYSRSFAEQLDLPAESKNLMEDPI